MPRAATSLPFGHAIRPRETKASQGKLEMGTTVRASPKRRQRSDTCKKLTSRTCNDADVNTCRQSLWLLRPPRPFAGSKSSLRHSDLYTHVKAAYCAPCGLQPRGTTGEDAHWPLRTLPPNPPTDLGFPRLSCSPHSKPTCLNVPLTKKKTKPGNPNP
jgi:hypothetical protein